MILFHFTQNCLFFLLYRWNKEDLTYYIARINYILNISRKNDSNTVTLQTIRWEVRVYQIFSSNFCQISILLLFSCIQNAINTLIINIDTYKKMALKRFFKECYIIFSSLSMHEQSFKFHYVLTFPWYWLYFRLNLLILW